MKAWRIYGTNDMRLEDVPMPKVKPGWLLARVKTFQPSITEIQRFSAISQRGLADMQEMIRTRGPFSMGHEVCAVVEDVLDEGSFRKGDRIAYFHHPTRICGRDYSGCFAEYYLLPIDSACKMDPAIPDIEGPALQPFSSCIHLVKEAGVKIGVTVAVYGQGVMGTNITQLCRLGGAERVIGVDMRDQCLDIARDLGADTVINAGQQDPVKAIMEATGGKGADIVFECASGSLEVGLSGGATFFQAAKSVRDSGTLVQIAFFHEPLTIDLNMLRFRNVKYIFPNEALFQDMEYGVRLLAQGKVRFKPTITHVLQGIENLPQAFDITAHKAKYGAVNPAVIVV